MILFILHSPSYFLQAVWRTHVQDNAFLPGNFINPFFEYPFGLLVVHIPNLFKVVVTIAQIFTAIVRKIEYIP